MLWLAFTLVGGGWISTGGDSMDAHACQVGARTSMTDMYEPSF